MSVKQKKFTIKEIKEYLSGCLILRCDQGYMTNLIENSSLKNAIHEIDDPEDGIEAVTERLKRYESEKSEKNSSGPHPS